MGKVLGAAIGLGLTAGALYGAEKLNDNYAWASVPVVDVPGDRVIGFDGVGDGELTLAERVEDGVKGVSKEVAEATGLVAEVAEGCGALALQTAADTLIFDQEGELVELTAEQLSAARGNIAETTFDFCMDERASDLTGIDGVTYDTGAYSAEAFTAQIEAISN